MGRVTFDECFAAWLGEHPDFAKARVDGLKAIGCNPANHPVWYDAMQHKVACARLCQASEEGLRAWAG